MITTGDFRAVRWWAHRRTMSGFFGRAWQKAWSTIEERRLELQEQDARRRRSAECGERRRPRQWAMADQDRYDEWHVEGPIFHEVAVSVERDDHGHLYIYEEDRVVPPSVFHQPRASKEEKRRQREDTMSCVAE